MKYMRRDKMGFLAPLFRCRKVIERCVESLNLTLQQGMNTDDFKASDGCVLTVHSNRVSHPKAIVVIAHGMAEHGKRYLRFSKNLNEAGFSLVAPDLRGHGQTSPQSGTRGSLGVGGRNRVIHDLEELISLEKKNHPSTPIVLFGHSMGSMIAMRIAQRGEVKIDGLILSAFPTHPGALVHAGKIVGRLLSAIFGQNSKSKFMDQLTFGKFSRGIKNRRTDFDWLSREAAEVDLYIADPDCGEVFTSRFFMELAYLTDEAHKNLNDLPTNLPLMYIAGGGDPVVGKYKGFLKVAETIKKHVPKAIANCYTDGRHELLNDTCREQVIHDILKFIREL